MTGSGEDIVSPAAPLGVPYPSSENRPLDEWSVAIYEELRSWAFQLQGRWEFWEPDYLVLTIDSFHGAVVEPVMIDTYQGELTITFGNWEKHLPSDGIYDETDSHRAAVRAKTLAAQWFSGQVATAIYFSAVDKWCGSKLVDEPIDLEAVADISWIEDFAPVRVEIRKAQKSDWRHFLISNGKLTPSE
jgi:hypothetical protein